MLFCSICTYYIRNYNIVKCETNRTYLKCCDKVFVFGVFKINYFLYKNVFLIFNVFIMYFFEYLFWVTIIIPILFLYMYFYSCSFGILNIFLQRSFSHFFYSNEAGKKIQKILISTQKCLYLEGKVQKTICLSFYLVLKLLFQLKIHKKKIFFFAEQFEVCFIIWKASVRLIQCYPNVP